VCVQVRVVEHEPADCSCYKDHSSIFSSMLAIYLCGRINGLIRRYVLIYEVCCSFKNASRCLATSSGAVMSATCPCPSRSAMRVSGRAAATVSTSRFQSVLCEPVSKRVGIVIFAACLPLKRVLWKAHNSFYPLSQVIVISPLNFSNSRSPVTISACWSFPSAAA
jgi:hypothetical protein